MSKRKRDKYSAEPFLYYKTSDEIAEYRRMPVRYKLQWLEEQMEFFHKTMSTKAKKIRDTLIREEK
jgi:hypothetical protein